MKHRTLGLTLKTLLAIGIAALTINQATAKTWVARHGMTSQAYQQAFNKYVDQGYRLVDVSGFDTNGKPRFAAVWWEQSSNSPLKWVARHGMTSSGYQKEFDKYVKQGYRLVDVSGYESNGKARYAAIWQKRGGKSKWQARHGMSSSQYQKTFDDLVAQGYRLTNISGYNVQGKVLFAGIWTKGGGAWQARHNMTSAQYQKTFNNLVAKGYRLTDVSGYEVNGQARYAAVWLKSSSFPWKARHGMNSAQYQKVFDDYAAKGYKLEHVSGYEVKGKPYYAAIWWKV